MRNVLEYLEKSAALYPNKTAIIDEYTSCCYGELKERSYHIGSAMASRIHNCAPVVVIMEKGIDALCAFFGIVYAGGYYVLMSPELPLARLKQIQKVLNAAFVITDNSNKNLAAEVFPSKSVLLIEDLKNTPVDNMLLESVRSRMIDIDALYANFTSGSTGIPKGVVVSHRSVIDFIEAFTELFKITQEDIIGNQAPFDFDVSVKDIYSAMKMGATMTVIPKHLFSRPKELLDFICDQQITTMIWAVSALCLISTFHGLDYRVPETVRRILFSGEVMPAKHLQIWMEHLPKAQFVNLYGPTEITCNCTYHIIEKGRSYEQGIPIGRAFPNEQVFLLDENDREVTASQMVGEICVRGTALALGYYRNAPQTAASFTVNPLNDCWSERIYRTGDLGKYNEEGELFFCGRRDFQIKHMGHRIELEEVEIAISDVPGIERCCCIFDEQKQKLYGFYIGNIERKDLYIKLKEKLPVFMIPGALRQVMDFQLTKNGKIDRKCLIERMNRR
jgi:D-alanine--poly(phosphoribitol) ligase subunit 1